MDSQKATVRFGPFEVDLVAGELRRNGNKIRLQAQPAQVLAILLERPGEVFTREELQRRLWPSDTFVDFEHSLNTAIKKLRSALGDDAEAPRYIETLPKRGYRFIGPLHKEGGPVAAALPTKPATHWNSAWKIGIGFAVLVLAFGIAWRFRPATPTPSKISPLVTVLGNINFPEFSPDGDRVVFTRAEPGETPVDLYVKSIPEGSLIKLTSTPGDYLIPRWSSDGRYIGFVDISADKAGIYIVPSLGGSVRRLLPLHPWNKGFDWSPDGKSLVYTDDESSQNLGRLHRVDLDTMQERTVPTGDFAASVPQYSPDGRWIAFGIGWDPLAVIPADGGKPVRLSTAEDVFINGFSWTPDSEEIVYGSSRGGVDGLWRVSIREQNRSPVLQGGGQFPTVAAVRNRLGYLALQPYVGSIFRLDLPTPANPNAHPPTKLITSTQLDEGPNISPDGKKIVFQSSRGSGGSFEIWMADSDGSNQVQLTNFRSGLVGTARWSPDGKWISFGREGVYVMSVNGGVPRKLDVCLGISSWSHDGKSIYCNGPPNTEQQIWNVPLEGGRARQVTHGGGFNAYEASDGKYVYYTKWTTGGIFRVPVEGGEEVKIVENPPADAWGYWSLFDDGVFYLAPDKTSTTIPYWIEFFDFAKETSTRVAPIRHHLFTLDAGFSISRDRTWMIYRGIEKDAETRLMIMENFR
jgi:Tol biopolymer transport system component/DNA-binding winged helix-turn-helix (wHTH) protein